MKVTHLFELVFDVVENTVGKGTNADNYDSKALTIPQLFFFFFFKIAMIQIMEKITVVINSVLSFNYVNIHAISPIIYIY